MCENTTDGPCIFYWAGALVHYYCMPRNHVLGAETRQTTLLSDTATKPPQAMKHAHRVGKHRPRRGCTCVPVRSEQNRMIS